MKKQYRSNVLDNLKLNTSIGGADGIIVAPCEAERNVGLASGK